VIQINETETGYAPIIVCDHCGEKIENAVQAAAIVSEFGKYQNGNLRVLHVHKVTCFDATEKKEGGKCAWEELSRHLQLLINNVRLTPRDLVEQEIIDKERGLTNK